VFSLRGWVRRFAALSLLIFQSPAFACAVNPYLIWMIPPFGVYALLISPWSPLSWFEETRWFVVRNITIPYMAFVGLVLVILGGEVFVASCIQLFRRWRLFVILYGIFKTIQVSRKNKRRF